MKDIKLNNGFKKFLYVIAWIGFILFGGLLLWIIALVLIQVQSKIPKKKNVLNQTYQKLIWSYGLIAWGLILFMLFIETFA